MNTVCRIHTVCHVENSVPDEHIVPQLEHCVPNEHSVPDEQRVPHLEHCVPDEHSVPHL
jgi:hypothetical protein